MKENNEGQPREDLVAGRNGVLELLRSETAVEVVYIQSGLKGLPPEIEERAAKRGIVLKEVAKIKLDQLVPEVPHQGVVAQVGESRYSSLEDIYKKAGDQPLFVVLCDQIQDPHNLGAIIRSAEGAGAHGVILPRRRSAGLSYVVSKSSAGAVEHMPVVRVTNLNDTIKTLQDKGVWFYVADMAGTPWHQQDYTGGVGLIVGSEGSGVSRLVKERSDFIVSIPMQGQVGSLNASVAAGIILFEIVRQRTLKG